MKPLLLVVLLVLLAGCHERATQPGPPTPLTEFASDPADPELDPHYDLLSASFRELNGSLLLILEFGSLQRQIPQYVARFLVTTREGTREYFARNEPDVNKPAPHLRFSMGRVVDGNFTERREVCHELPGPEPKWTATFDLPHNATGLVHGGRITWLRAESLTWDNELQDVLEASGDLRVRGGVNPHTQCPLVAERPA